MSRLKRDMPHPNPNVPRPAADGAALDELRVRFAFLDDNGDLDVVGHGLIGCLEPA